jgi:REP element-mobilizing transposase RayT
MSSFIGRKQLAHNPPTFVDTAVAIFFVTICAKERHSGPLTQSGTAQQLLGSLVSPEIQQSWFIDLALIMPDHVHLLVRTEMLASRVANWKQWTARRFQVQWQRGFFDHRIRTEESLLQKRDYILNNPVRAGLVGVAGEWPYQYVAKFGSRAR